MPPAIIAAVAAVATAAISYAAAVGAISAIVAALLTIAVSIGAMLLTRRPQQQRTNQGQELKLKLDPGMPRQLPLGTCATGGSVVWAFTWGAAKNVPANANLVRIIALSDLPCQALVGIYEGKDQLSFVGDVTAGMRACNQHKTDGGNTRMWCRVYLGGLVATADPNLQTWSGGQWTSRHKGTNMCYAIVRMQYDEDGNAFPNGEPQLVFVLDGVSCYDQRFDSSRGVGHSGTQRLDDPSTWAFTRNAAIEAQQVLRGFYSKGQLLIGAQAEDRDLSDSMLISAYNTCEESVAKIGAGGGTQPRYEGNYLATSSQPVVDILTQLQAAMDGRIVDRGGAITLRPGATHTPVFNLTDADIFWDQEKSWQPRLALSELYNYVTGVFVDKETIYQEKPFPPQRNVQYEKDDGGQRFEMQLGFAAITDWSQVQRITHRIHLASRLQGTIAFFLPLWALEAEQDDWFTITSARWNFNTKYFQIITSDLTMSPMPMVAIVARETAVTIDGWAPALNEVPRDDTFWIAPVGRVLPIPTIVATPITKTSTTEVVEQYGVSIVVTDLGDTPGTADSLELEIAPTADLAAAYNLGIYVSRDQTIEVYSLLANFAYSVRGRTYNGTQFSDWSPWSNFTTTASSIGYSVVVTPSLTLQANSDGSLNPAGQLPTSIVVDVVRGATSIKLDDTVDYAIIPTGCSASIDDTNGSATKGNIDLTNLSGWDGSIDVFVQVNGVALPSVRVVLSKTVAAGSGGSSGGGTGSKVAADNTLATITSSSDADITNVLTVTLAGGESLYGTGTISYNVRPLNTNVTDHLVAKWRYSPAGAGTWTDFPSSPIIGDDGYSGAPEDTPYNGSAVMTQTKSGLSAGDYDVKVVGHSNGGSTMHLGGTMKIEAKV